MLVSHGMTSCNLVLLLFTTAVSSFAGSLPTRMRSCVNPHLHKFAVIFRSWDGWKLLCFLEEISHWKASLAQQALPYSSPKPWCCWCHAHLLLKWALHNNSEQKGKNKKSCDWLKLWERIHFALSWPGLCPRRTVNNPSPPVPLVINNQSRPLDFTSTHFTVNMKVPADTSTDGHWFDTDWWVTSSPFC